MKVTQKPYGPNIVIGRNLTFCLYAKTKEIEGPQKLAQTLCIGTVLLDKYQENCRQDILLFTFQWRTEFYVDRIQK